MRADEVFRLLDSTRFAMRGHTYVAAWDSDEATKANPATLAEAGKLALQFRWLQFDAFIGSNAVATISDVASAASGSGSGLDFLKKFGDKFGERQFLRLQLLPLALRVFRFEMAPFVTNATRVDLHLPQTPEFAFSNDTIAGVNLAYAHPIGKEWALGVTLRPFYRNYMSGDLGVADVTGLMGATDFDMSTFFLNRGAMGLGLDIGAIWNVTKVARLGLLVQDLGDSGYLSGDDPGPPPIRQKVSVGGLARKSWGKWNLDFMGDLEDLLDKADIGYLRHLHLGTEFGRSLFTRDHDIGLALGVDEGYIVGGAFLDIWILRLDIANYAAETGYNPGQAVDRRWAFSMRTTTTF